MTENEIPEGLKEQSDKAYLALVEKYERKYLDEDGEEIDLDNDDSLQEGDVIGYHCTGCGHVQQTTGLNYDCDKCCGCTLEEIIE